MIGAPTAFFGLQHNIHGVIFSSYQTSPSHPNGSTPSVGGQEDLGELALGVGGWGRTIGNVSRDGVCVCGRIEGLVEEEFLLNRGIGSEPHLSLKCPSVCLTLVSGCFHLVARHVG